MFSILSLLKVVAKNILEPVLWTEKCNRIFLVMISYFIKLTEAVSVTPMTAPHIAVVVLGNLIVPLDKPDTILTDNGEHFT